MNIDESKLELLLTIFYMVLYNAFLFWVVGDWVEGLLGLIAFLTNPWVPFMFAAYTINFIKK